MRKKLTGLLAVFACLLMLTACSGTASGTEEIPDEIRTSLFSLTEGTAQQMDAVVEGGMIEEQKSNKTIYTGLQSWQTAKEETGAIDFTTDADGNGVADCFTEKTVSRDDDGNYVVTVEVAGEKKTADLVVSYNEEMNDYVSMVTNVNYSGAELMQQAGLNTLLGMGTTFAVLILLSLIIAAFGRIFTVYAAKKAEERAKKEEEAAASKSSAPAAQGSLASAQTTADDGALVAVIAAAIAAYRAEAEPGVDPDGFVVRRIRRIHRK